MHTQFYDAVTLYFAKVYFIIIQNASEKIVCNFFMKEAAGLETAAPFGKTFTNM